MDIVDIIKVVFKVFYLLLIIRLIFNIKNRGRDQFRIINLKKNFWEEAVKLFTEPVCKPFMNILKLNFDLSPAIALLLLVYFIEPFVVFLIQLFGLSLY